MNEKLSERMREYLFRLSEREPVTMPEVGWPDEVAALESKLEAMKNAAIIVIVALANHNTTEASEAEIDNVREMLEAALAVAQESQPE